MRRKLHNILEENVSDLKTKSLTKKKKKKQPFLSLSSATFILSFPPHVTKDHRENIRKITKKKEKKNKKDRDRAKTKII